MKTPEELFTTFAALAIDSHTVSHEPVFTVDEAKRVRTEHPVEGTHIKNLFLRNKKKAMWLVVVAEDRRVNLKALAKRLDAGHLSFGSPDRLRTYLGVEPGAVTPLSIINDQVGQVKVVVDQVVLDGERVCCHPLVNTMTTSLATPDLLRFLEHLQHAPTALDFSALES